MAELDQPCPRCGTPHLHVAVSIDLGAAVLAGTDDDGTIVVNPRPWTSMGTIEAEVTCCACDLFEQRPVRFTS